MIIHYHGLFGLTCHLIAAFYLRRISKAQSFPIGPQTNSLVLPGIASNTFSDSESELTGVKSYQLRYNAANFRALVDVSLIEIVGIAFRVDEDSTTIDQTLSGLQIFLSTYTGSITNLSVHPSWNHGGDRRLVFAAETLHLRGVRDLANPQLFQFTLPFQSPFLYNPSLGHLLVDVSKSDVKGTGSVDASASDDGSIYKVVDTLLGGYIEKGGDVIKISYIAPPKLSLELKAAGQGELSFYALGARSYAIDTIHSLNEGSTWTTLTNYFATSGQLLHLPIALFEKEQFFRLRLQ